MCFVSLILVLAGCYGGGKSDNKTTQATEDSSKAAPAQKKTILFFGNSLTAGLGVEASEAFPAIIQHTLDSLKLPYRAVNAGLSGETTAGGKNRIEWLLKQKVDVFVLELGANDGLRGIPVTETSKNLQVILDKVKEKYPGAKQVLLGMQVPPNMGSTYTKAFSSIFPDLASKNKIALVPFLLKDVGGIPDLNQADGIHPTPKGHLILAKNVWEVLKGEL